MTANGKDNFGKTGEDINKLTAAYWGAEKVWDWNQQHYNHISFDNAGSEIQIFGMQMFNALWTVWNGKGEAYFGYSTGIDLASLDIVGHELTHGTIDGTA